MVAFSAAAKTKKKTASDLPPPPPDKILLEARLSWQMGDLKAAKKGFELLLSKYPDETMGSSNLDDVEIGGGMSYTTYGSVAKQELEFLNLEIKEGKRRLFKNSDKALEELSAAFEINDFKTLEKQSWVRVKFGGCGSEPADILPSHLKREIQRLLEPKGAKVHNVELVLGPVPTLKAQLQTDSFIELRLSPYQSGWVWDWFTFCQRKI